MSRTTLHGLERWSRFLPLPERKALLAQAVKFGLDVDLDLAFEESPSQPPEVEIFNAFVRQCEDLVFFEMRPISVESDSSGPYEQVIAWDTDGDVEWKVQIRSSGVAIVLDSEGWPEEADLLEWILNVVVVQFVLEPPYRLTTFAAADVPPPEGAGAFQRLNLPATQAPLVQPKFYFLENVLAFSDMANSRHEFWVGSKDAAGLEVAKSKLVSHGFTPY